MQACNVVVDFGPDPTGRKQHRRLSELVLEVDGEFTFMVNSLAELRNFQKPKAQRWALLRISDSALESAAPPPPPPKKRKVN